MKSKQENEVLKVYELYWDSYLKGDMEIFASIIDDEFEMIGTSENEYAHNKTEGIAFYTAQLHEVVGKTEMRNRNISIKGLNKMYLINERCEIYVLIESEWAFYSIIRVSTLLRKSESEWKVIQQHGSFPDIRVKEGETLAIAKINKENIELRDAVKRRTIELVHKNRELEIEAAIERVRAKAMEMQNSNELTEVVAVLFQKLKDLQIPFTAVGIATGIEGSKDLNAFVCGQNDAGLVITNYRLPYFNNPIPKDLFNALQKQSHFFVGHYSKEEKDAFYSYVIEHTAEFRHLPEDIKRMIFDSSTYSISMVAVKNAVFNVNDFEGKVLSLNEIDIIKRFARVFDQAYTRFLDLQKAEAQTKEAQIELALERIRAKVTSMQISTDLLEIVVTLRTEFVKLGHEAHYFWHMRWLPDVYQKAMTSGDGSKIGMVMTLPRQIHGDILSVANWEKSKESTFILAMGVDDAVDYVDKMIKLGDFEQVDPQAPTLDDIRHIGGLTFVMARTTHGEIGFSLPGVVPNPSKEALETLVRFAGVFDLAYRRFEDLKKAEAQARENQIELALERVRSRSMAMRKSDELAELSLELVKQVKGLGVETWFCAFNINDDDGKSSLEWGSNGENTFPKYRTPREGVFLKYFNAGQSGETLLINEISKQECPKHYNYLCSLPGVGEQLLKMKEAGVPFPISQIDHVAFFKFGYILFITFEPAPEAHDIFIRFARVFEQTYTRFLDLQKAETQAREAQIEAALERVRSKSLAMHKTADLQSVIHTVHQELLNLNLSISGGSFIVINSEIDNELICWGSGGTADTSDKVHIPRFEKPFYTHLLNGIKSGPGFFAEEYTREEKVEFFSFLFQHKPWSSLDSKQKEETLSAPGGYARSCVVSKHTSIFIINHFGEKFSDDENAILKRFGKVFEQAYNRFLDLQKAEAQAREAKIEAALERSRTQSMLMQHSDEIKNISEVFHQQLLGLNIPTEFSYVWLPDESKNIHQFWASWAEEKKGDVIFRSKQVTYPLDKTESYTAACYAAWANPEEVHIEFIPPSDIYDFFSAWAELLYGSKNLKAKNFKEGIYYAEAYMRYGCFGINIRRKLSADEKQVLKRFSIEFERAYTRFLDLQKAEAQARESRIEAALERVRSRSLAMHHSSELSVVVDTLLQEFTNLEFTLTFCIINLIDEEDMSNTVWAANPETGKDAESYYMKFEDFDFHRAMWNAWKAQDKRFVYTAEGEEKKIYDEYLYSDTEFRRFPKHIQDANKALERYVAGFTFFKYSGLQTVSVNEITEAELEILERFGKVFEQAYTRFLDLQKAEAQTREAQIEASLERVRAAAMAMHQSDELPDMLSVLFDQFDILGINPSFTHLTLFDEINETFSYRMSGRAGHRVLVEQVYDINMLEPWKTAFRHWKEGDPNTINCIDYPPEVLPMMFDIIEPITSAMPEESRIRIEDFPNGLYTVQGHCKFGYLGFHHSRNATEEEKKIVVRFAGEFGRVYQRFLDLKKAELQAREAKIEVALEKVRSRTMGMQKSDELADVAKVLFQEMNNFVHNLWTCGFVLCEKNRIEDEWWLSLEDGFTRGFFLPNVNDFAHSHLYEGWLEKDDFRAVQLEGNQLKEHYNWLMEIPIAKTIFDEMEAAGMQPPEWQKLHAAYFSKGYLIIITREPCAEEAIFKRFAQVFDLTYTRFYDLKKAELQALDATKRASVDRVRAEIASMRTTTDLERIQPLIWNELTTLGVPFIRCGVFIMIEEKQAVQAFLSTPDGKSIATFHLPYNGTDQTKQIVAHWQQRQIFKDHMDEEAFTEYTQQLVQQGAIPADEKYVTENRPKNLHLHFLPFLQGMLYVGNDAPLKPDEIQLVQNLTDAFSTAYARYDDFNKLEAAKASVEAAMSELKATQNQLVQQEKLASLGQLTAGIAHEIKNPLNFVNNFSDVSLEMIDEALDELKKIGENDHAAETAVILVDIKFNLAKIHEHGSRANGIVQSMLMHSRGGTGKMDLTDLNALVKEYVNLAFHGMRARKEAINVDIDLQLDENVGEMPLIAEDFSRVILNICNNGFDAMRSKLTEKGQPKTGYMPKLTIRTKSRNGQILIEIEDNGPGIPDNIKDKILQPFFTTKKGTEGTGLGLSITHDIIKVHGGELKVETIVDEGTTFIIYLENK
jgi:signal transduction histidine kinase